MDNQFKVHPYFLGLWLGDGNKENVGITTIDKEVSDFIFWYANLLKLKVRIKTKSHSKANAYYIYSPDKYTHSVECYNLDGTFIERFDSIKEAAGKYEVKHPSNISACCIGTTAYCKNKLWKYSNMVYPNLLHDYFKTNNIFRNKHIPKEVYSEDFNYRMNVLAGFIDSDGTKESTYKITISQKLENLIDDLMLLCESLDIQCIKVAKCTKYKGEPYHYHLIRMWGSNLELCPIKLSRKKVNNNKIYGNITDRKS